MGGPDALTDTPQGGEHTGTSCPTGDTGRDMGGATALTRASSGMRMTSPSDRRLVRVGSGGGVEVGVYVIVYSVCV